MTKAVSTETVTTGWTHQRSSRRVATSGPPRAPPRTTFVELSTTATSAPPCELAPWPILGNLVGGPGPSEPASRTDPWGEAEAHRPLVFPLARDQEGDDVLDERGGRTRRRSRRGAHQADGPLESRRREGPHHGLGVVARDDPRDQGHADAGAHQGRAAADHGAVEGRQGREPGALEGAERGRAQVVALAEHDEGHVAQLFEPHLVL